MMMPSFTYWLLIWATTYIHTSHADLVDACNTVEFISEHPYVKCYTDEEYNKQPENDKCPSGMTMGGVYQPFPRRPCIPHECSVIHTARRLGCSETKCHYECIGDEYHTSGYSLCTALFFCGDMPRGAEADRQCMVSLDAMHQYWRQPDPTAAESTALCAAYDGDYGRNTYEFEPDNTLCDTGAAAGMARCIGSFILCRSADPEQSKAIKRLVCRSQQHARARGAAVTDAFIEYENELSGSEKAYNLLADYAYDVEIEEAREHRAIARLQNKKKKILRLKQQNT